MRGFRAIGGVAAVVALALLLGAERADAQASAQAQSQARPDTSIAALRAENARLAARVDSLAESLRQHRYPENFLTSALEQQATFYGVFVTVVVAMFGLATYLDFRREGRRSVEDSRRAVRDALIRVRRLNKDQRSTTAGMVAEQKRVVSDALASVRRVEEDSLGSVRRVEEELRAEVRTALDTHRQESAGWNARLMEAERFMRRAAGNAYVAIASVHGPAFRGRTIAAHLLASGNFYAAGYDGRNERVGAANLDTALRALNGIAAPDRQTVAGQMAREAARVAEAFDLLRVHAGREADAVVAEIRVRLQELSGTIATDAPGVPRAPGEPSFSG
jgi:hypothetical protein